MLVYYFTSAKYAVQSIEKMRLKLARLSDMNDPFELMALEARTPAERTLLNDLKTELNDDIGVLCFTKDWHNPVHWSHYADCHKGICLEFEVLDARLEHVRYRSTRLTLGPSTRDNKFAMDLITTKFSHWSYEREARSLYRLNMAKAEVKDGKELHFVGYENPGYPHLTLSKVILGSRCTETLDRLRALVAHFDPAVKVIKARTAFRTFKVVTDRRSLAHPAKK